jgi:glycosyltransferase involved in cell wall biosynthesis
MEPSLPSTLALIVLTRDEEANLRHCLESVRGLADEIFVVDSGSTDRTCDIAREYTPNVVTHPFSTQAEQFNWALDTLPITCDWVLRLDADEFLLPELRDEIAKTIPTLPAAVTGLYLRRRVYFKGHWIRHGGYYPTWLLRLFRRGAGRSEEIEMDEHLIVRWGETRRLTNDFVDYNRKDLAFWTVKHEGYAAREARMALSGGREISDALNDKPARQRWLKMNVYGRAPLFLRAFVYFFYRYVVLRGFQDGTPGLIFHFLQACWYRFYVDAKIWEVQQQQRHGPR